MAPPVQTAASQHDVIRYLHARYYADGAVPQQSAFISSHWEHYSRRAEVRVDAEGRLVSLAGVAFGVCRWEGRIHRLLDRLCVLCHLAHLPHRGELLRLRAVAARVSAAMGLHPTLDVFRQVCTLALLWRHLPDAMRRRRLRVLMIGDGYGVLSALFKSILPDATIVMVDIGRVLLFQAVHCQRAHPGRVHALAGAANDRAAVDFLYCPAEDLPKLDGFTFDIAVNIASMQEMTPPTVARYFDFLRGHLALCNLFYCCNRDSKTLVGGEVSEFLGYPWRDEDRFPVDGPCPWHQYFFAAWRAQRGLTVLGVRVPLVNFYDGPVRHRLAVLATG
jgi:hypothetical protein